VSDIGVWSVVGLIVIVLAMLGWIVAIVRAQRDPVQTKERRGKLKRGPVSGGAIRGDPGQNTLTGEAPRQDEPSRDSPTDR
jgi:hypothetical protein